MSRPLPRRTVILGLGAGLGAGLAVSGCSAHADPAVTARYRGEYRTIARAAALENQAVSVYRALLAGPAARGSGSAPAFARLAEACARHHVEHAATWNAILLAGREPAMAGTPLRGASGVLRSARSAATVEEAAALALRFETEAAETYVNAVGSLSSRPGIAAAASIAPVEAMHAALLRFLAGDDPVPMSFLAPG